ncbi:hypothetical protein PHYBLDRAFT_179927 [Phycomyces blakesleeanus NRRL 1555(-)]|uniref:SH3 domain-containing protein n=1 Tax=Phycomyces blakesleeanus (strain ATCC 8743b / DSM 1359 / FGSC 10004 / NBRC 33097 / NRRL 1555) TaxID=763407 RepID=A0A167PBL5_PHYB8|nr:hypothetical protein PHYBLDRAFT_179927 [Phycomyces blakesleeanus NRRL 1555(-)]OAD77608.1 hypothetical protein PHYBLDRAFT_179927 [Phycomyces blakesleeanus NRRL 1555(-)]|eukprot:XP_018295648.1 hypothetical protein PHYBLDRAFT_179927 [Phycomyces blakesleeanus NRRL 1555(-)]
MTETALPPLDSFSNNFWGKDDAGYEVLTSKMNYTKKTFEELKAFYSIRASLHEEYGKKLLKHVKTDLGRDEIGTLRVLLLSAHKELEMAAQTSIEIAQKIRINVEVLLDNFILEQKDKRRLLQTNVDKAHRNKQLHATHVTRITLEKQFASAGQREQDRLRQKIERCTHDIKTLDNEYQNACLKSAEATSVWNTEWKIACDIFNKRYQDMEEKRVDFIHHSMSVYVNILQTASGKDQECDSRMDIVTFIEEKGTGPMIPEPPEYVNYLDDPAKTLPKYIIANFSDHDIAPLTQNDMLKKVESNRKSMSMISLCEPVANLTRALTKPRVRRKAATIGPDDEMMKKVLERRASTYSTTPELVQDDLSYRKPGPAPKEEPALIMDEPIDPRAQVVFSIGNNMFNVNPLLDQGTISEKPSRKTNPQNTRDLDEVCDISIKELLDQLGVPNPAQKEEEPRQRRERQRSTSEMRGATRQRERTLSQNAISEPYNTNKTLLRRSSTNEIQTEISRNSSITETKDDGIKVWARTLYDYTSAQSGELSFTRGTWVAVVRTDHKEWWWAYKWNEEADELTDEGGYVARVYLEMF